MKVALLSGASSIHTIRWANGLAEAGLEVHLISQQPQLEPMDARVQVHILPFRGVLGYFTMVPAVKRLLKLIKPDIVNAHYASGYGTTARLVGYYPWLLSVWGSDIYDFPYKSPLHKYLVNKNLLAANSVASTSICMAEQTRSIAPKLSHIAITPFGVDTVYYDSLTTSLANRDANLPIIIGTVKTLAPLYGIDILIKAFEILLKNLSQTHPEIEKSLRLRLVGAGHQELELKALTQQLGISKRIDFVGRVDSSQVPVELEKLDIYVALSRQESFGVAIIEAGAAGRPVVVSNAGGLPEVVLDGQTGIVVPKENPQAAADAISKLVLDRDLRIQMGEAGKQHVIDTYDWSACINTMTNLYEKIINQYKSKL
ncbi:glycosyltransferase [Psychrobacter sp. DAB_AL32B]|uniref:glycosyltransferase n=1 Tax=Psychrobacter sp. DAB_AL32B TaxID=1028414 RepID=UPI000B7E7A94|nr:glycosyltransferase [Psychrobacter sp. DAB_AL32B]OXL20527.1 group 1 glycosyl transferase [Psychrobacter sp. DAB_AL32B]